MSDTAQQIKEKLDLGDFLRTYLQVTPAGKNLKANCPFHKEKSPSFMISQDRQIWHCFGCGAGGDIIGFLMKYENLEFFEALKILGEKAGIDVGRMGTQDQRKINVLYDLNKAAKEFFRKSLTPQATDYLTKRGLKPETVEEFEIGFAPDSSDSLTRALLGARYNVLDVERAGLVFKTQRGTYCDRFRNRIMFPLHNQFGKVIGFTGRIMPMPSEALAKEGGYEPPKYVNSPETPIFNKSKLLYGLDKSKNAIREARAAVLVEGQMDFIMSWQDGVKNIVATSGTALTMDHLKNLKRIAESLILSFDQDEAGQIATERTIDLANSVDLSSKILRVPPELKVKDPADIAQSNPGVLKSLIEKAQLAMHYYFDKYPISGLPIAEVKKNIRTILSKIKHFDSAVEKEYWMKEVAKLSGFGESNLTEEMEKLKTDLPRTENSDNEPLADQAPIFRKDLISQRVASLVLSNKDLYNDIILKLTHLPQNYQTVIAYHFDPVRDKSPEATALQARVSNGVDNHRPPLSPELQALSDLVNLRSGLETIPDPVKAKEELAELFRQITLENFKDKRQILLTAIRNAEAKNDETALTKALEDFDRLSKDMQNSQ